MNYEYIKTKTLEVYKSSKTISFPIDCFKILEALEIPCKSYSALTEEKRAHCYMVSDDSFTLKGIIFYNDASLSGRIRFSLMHELGHLILGHKKTPTKEMEMEANFFASHILAPRMAIHYAHCKNENDVAKHFSLTQECSRYAFNDYKRWRKHMIYHQMSPFDKALYQHFYDINQERFVYHRDFCYLCGDDTYNSQDGFCINCSKMFRQHELKSSYLNARMYGDEI